MKFKDIFLGVAVSLVFLGIFSLRGGGRSDVLADIPLAAADYEALQVPAQLLESSPPVIILGAPWCPACRHAARDLGNRKIPYFDANIEENSRASELYGQSGSAGIPVILVGGKAYGGYSGDLIEKEWRKIGDIQKSTVD